MDNLAGEDGEDALEFSERNERSWRAYLRAFQSDVFPMFAEFGFTMPQAYAVWEINRLKNMVNDLLEKFDDK
jgi:hypothetical protein